MFKFSIQREALLNALLLVSGAVEKKQSLPILANVFLRVSESSLFVHATDTEIGLTALVALTDVETCGELTVPARKLLDICRSANEGEKIQLSAKDSRVQIKAGRSRYTLSGLAATDYPLVEAEVNELEFSLPRESFMTLMQSTYFSMAQQDVRYYLNGLLVELISNQMVSASTDGHRLSVCELQLEKSLGESRFILPRKAVQELLRILADNEEPNVALSLSKNHFYLTTKNASFCTKLIEGRFPNYRRVIPDNNDKALFVERDVLKKALNRVSILANEKYRAVSFSLSTCKLAIVARNQEQEEAVDELEVDTQGEPISVGMNASYLLDVLNNVPPGIVELSFSTPDKSILIRSPNQTHAKYIIMPLKI